MFGFLKKKIKETSEKIAEEIVEDAKTISEDQISEEEKQELEKEKKGFFKKVFSKKKKEEQPEEIKSIEEEIAEEQAKINAEDAVKEEKVEEKPVIEEPKEIIKKIVEEVPVPEPEVEEKVEEIKEEPVIEEPKEKSKEEVIEEAPKPIIEEIKETTKIKKQVPENEVHITYFVHGTTKDNEAGVCTGQNSTELSALGITQSEELINQTKYDFDKIFTSDLKRAIDSANITWPDKETIVDKRLRECDYGKLNGQHKSKLNEFKKDHNPIYENYPKGESYNEVTARIRKFLNDLYKKYKGKHIAIAAHRYSQLAIEVLLNNKTWTQALAEDWRLRKAWQPGWEYKITQKVEKHIEKKKDLLKKEDFPALEKPHIQEEVHVKEAKEDKKEKLVDLTQKKKGIFKKLSEKIIKLNITDEKFDELFWDLEVALLENNVAVEVIEKIKFNLKEELENTKVTRRSIDEIILNNLRQTIESLFGYEPIDLIEKIKTSEKPYKILMLGVNGSGKTTTIGKLIKYFQDNNLTCVVAASDTFRAAAIQQIEEHTNNLNTKLIKHDYGADPAAVAYDTIEHAKSKSVDVVLIDTAGRLHSNSNLMQELEKVIRVVNPNMKIFIGESITGNDCVEQAKEFNKSVGIDGIILTKADIDEKGGAAISISHVTEKPILFITTGQEYKDLKKFNAEEIISSVFE